MSDRTVAVTGVVLSLLGEERAYGWLRYAPFPLNWEAAIVFSSCLVSFILLWKRRYPENFQLHRQTLRAIFGEAFDSLWTYLFVGVLDVFWVLDLVLVPVIWFWGVWIIFVSEAALIIAMIEWRFGTGWRETVLRFLSASVSRIGSHYRNGIIF